MLNLSRLLEAVSKPFAELLSLDGRGLHWMPLLGAVVIAFAVYLRRRDKRESIGLLGFFRFCIPTRIYSFAAAKLDFKFIVIHTLLYGGLIAPMLLTSGDVADATLRFLVEIFGVPDVILPDSVVTDIALMIAIALAADLGFFISHYLQHRIPFLWEFHKVHHSIEVMHPISGYREHPVGEAIKMTFSAIGIGVALGASAYLTGRPTEGLTLLGVNALVLVYGIAGGFLRHSHIWLSFGSLDRIFVSPAVHQIHHSRSPQHWNKNLGGMFSIWDWLLGTLYLPTERETPPLGLYGGEHREYNSVLRIYLLPFLKIARRASAMLEITKRQNLFARQQHRQRQRHGSVRHHHAT